MPRSKKKEKSPTPFLDLPDSKRQHFTYSENKLLDQITIEVMEAWRKDLLVIKKHQTKVIEVGENCERLAGNLREITFQLQIALDKIKQYSELIEEKRRKSWWQKFFKRRS